MLAFEVSLNGEKKLLAGFHDWDILHAILDAKRQSGSNEEDELSLTIGGLAQQTTKGHHEHVRWSRLKLAINDTIAIRLIEVDAADAPRKRYRSDAKVQEDPFTEEEILEMEKEDYLRLKAKFEDSSKI